MGETAPRNYVKVGFPDVPDHERLRRLEERHDHELMDYEERCELWSRIAAARRELARQKA